MSLLISNLVRLKRFIRRYPKAYLSLQKTYYKLLFAGENCFWGTKMHEWIWKRQNGPSAEEFQEHLMHPHREHLIQSLLKWTPFERVLEVGCNAGQNLFLLHDKYPKAFFYGLDINPHFIHAGNELGRQKQIENVFLRTGKADDLSVFSDRSMDIAFSDATLMYIGPDKIDQTIREIRRVTKRAMIFNEWNMESIFSGKNSLWYDFHWVHDYKKIIMNNVPRSKITTQKVPEGLWLAGGGWEKYGTFIEVEL